MSTIKYVFEGSGKPKIIFLDGQYHVLPEPIGPDKESLRMYDFEEFTREKYWSEKGNGISIGKKFIFSADLRWISMSKESLKKLWKAQKEASFTFLLNEDVDTIQFKVEVTGLTYRFFKGHYNAKAGYSVNLKLRGKELLSGSGYQSVLSGEGYGANYGETVEGQSP